MHNKPIIAIALAICFSLPTSQAFAGMVVDLNPSAALVGPARTTADVSNTGELTFNFDASNPFFNNPANGQTFYGGYTATGSGVVGTLDTDLFGGNFNIENTRAASGAMRGRSIWIWDSADFLDGTVSAFDGTADSSLSITTANWNTPDPEAIKFVIRDGSSYYISNESLTAANNTLSIDGTTAGLEWATIDPNLFGDYSAGGGNIGPGGAALSYSAQTFSSVTGVGFITESERGGGGPMFIQIADFQANLTATAVPEPSSLALVGVASVGLFLRRRQRKLAESS